MSARATAHPPAARTHVEILITRVIAADYLVREVFPELLRTSEAVTRVSRSHIYRVPIEYAEKVLEDAEERRSDRTLPKGMPKAFSALIERLSDDIRRAKGLWALPGLAVAVSRRDEELACFKPGDRVRFCSSDADDERDGKPLTIVEPYGIKTTLCEGGEYVDSQGRRCTYLPGYIARDDAGNRYCYAAGQVQTWDYKPGHLRLAYSRKG